MLGLDEASATEAEVRAARRRLARDLHPDLVVGRCEEEIRVFTGRLAEVNQAADLALELLVARAAAPPEHVHPPHVPMPTPRPEDQAVWADAEPDEAIFSVPRLPVEAFELLLLAFSSIGDPKVVDEPYVLEGQVDDPFLGVARVELAPEAGGSLVTVTTRPAARGAPAPTPGQVASRLLWEVRAFDG